MNYHEYRAPEGAAGWRGYYKDDKGNVMAFLGMDGEIVPVSEIDGWDMGDDDRNDSPYGVIGWKV